MTNTELLQAIYDDVQNVRVDYTMLKLNSTKLRLM